MSAKSETNLSETENTRLPVIPNLVEQTHFKLKDIVSITSDPKAPIDL